ncbi:MAG: UbiD family decarboxylase, partial [Candidatus Poribacteria bacterium]|nr:UbiD family decarboxylase [Candidatus Poribacteria bacterium]
MAYSSLREFVKALENAGELKRIKTKVSPDLEITEITDRVSKAEGPALLFENVEGSEMPLLINAFGSNLRMAMALGVEALDEVADEIEGMIKIGPPESLLDKVKILGVLAKLTNFPPKTVRRGACQEVALTGDQVSLATLPMIKCWPLDADKYITLPQVFTHSLKTGQRNVGTYRLQRLDDKTLAMHWQIHHDGAAHFREYRESGARMPVAVAIGGDPVMSYIGTAPLPTGIDELLFAGFLRKSNVSMVQCKTIDMNVPADADIILEGYIEPDETCVEGPFGDHTGFYSLADEYPVFHLTAITHRKNPIYQTIIVGK